MNFIKLFLNIVRVCDLNHKFTLIVLLLLNFLSSVLDLIALSFFYPLILFIINPEGLLQSKIILDIIQFLHFDYSQIHKIITANNFLKYNVTIIISLFTLRIFISIICQYIELNLLAKVLILSKEKILNKFLDFNKMKGLNLSELTSSKFLRYINNDCYDITEYLSSFIILINEFIFLFIGLNILLAINYEITIATFVLIFIIAILFYLIVKKYLSKIGSQRVFYWTKKIEILQGIYNSLIQIKLLAKKKFFINDYIFNAKIFEKVNIGKKILPKIQKLFIEWILLVVVLLIILYFSIKNYNLKELIPLLSIFFLIITKLIPSATKILNAFQTINILSKPANDFIKNIGSFKNNIYAKINKIKNIKFNNIDFSYDNKKKIFQKFSFEIKSGDKIGIKGESGSGKTTFLYLLLGILKPTKGIVHYNNSRKNINLDMLVNKVGYVPQDVYLLNETIVNNIALEEFKNFKNNLADAMKDALVQKSNINSSYFTNKKIGENGSQLSGGQKQRVSIARALYQDSDLLIFDEASSSLDPLTEKKIIKNIFKNYKNRTIIFVSHRDSSLKFCTKILDLTKK